MTYFRKTGLVEFIFVGIFCSSKVFAPPYNVTTCARAYSVHLAKALEGLAGSGVPGDILPTIAQRDAQNKVALDQRRAAIQESSILDDLIAQWEKDNRRAVRDLVGKVPDSDLTKRAVERANNLLNERVEKALAKPATPGKYSLLAQYFPSWKSVRHEDLVSALGISDMMGEVNGFRALYFKAASNILQNPEDYPADSKARMGIAARWAAEHAADFHTNGLLGGLVNITDLRRVHGVSKFERLVPKFVAVRDSDAALTRLQSVANDERLPPHVQDFLQSYIDFCKSEGLPPLSDFESRIESFFSDNPRFK